MARTLFNAIVVTETENNEYKMALQERNIEDLPQGDLLIRVHYSSLNYKDALSSIGNKGVTKTYPHTPGIDAAGIVEESSVDDFEIGDKVLVTGYDFGMNTSGGFAEYIRVPAKWVIKLPNLLSLRESMVYGTAGFTAALSVYKLTKASVNPSDGEILVTGATGGVGSVAVALLAKLGYDVVAATGKLSESEMLKTLGAKSVINRHDVDDQSNRPMIRGRWAGVIDTVGGNILATAIKSTNYGGVVTCCGNVGGGDFSTSVYPFILRGVTLFGIDSVLCPMPLRKEIWEKLASEWKLYNLEESVEEVSLGGLVDKIDAMLKGNHKGRTIVKV